MMATICQGLRELLAMKQELTTERAASDKKLMKRTQDRQGPGVSEERPQEAIQQNKEVWLKLSDVCTTMECSRTQVKGNLS